MIKGPQIGEIHAEGFHYITYLPKPQIETLLGAGILELDMFDEKRSEVTDEGVRYVLRRNPQRAAQIASTRQSKRNKVQALVEAKNAYLAEHPRALVDSALRAVRVKAAKLEVESWLKVEAQERVLKLQVDDEELERLSELDGCYVIKTDVPGVKVNAQTVHSRYKDLALVEQAFRTSKTAHLDVRPIYVRDGDHTRGHVQVVMLACMIVTELRRLWREHDVTVEDGLDMLAQVTADEWEVARLGTTILKIAVPRPELAQLLKAAEIVLPDALPRSSAKVVTKTKLQNNRKNA